MSIVTVSPNKHPAFHLSPYAMICIASMAGFAAALFFSAFPGVDRGLAALFYMGDGEFLFSTPDNGAWLSKLLQAIFWLVCFVAVAGFALAAFFERRLLGLGFAAWTYAALCLAIGPGLVTNAILQESWGRAPPAQITQFGGDKEFTAALTRTDQCETDCTFVNSSASNYTMLGFIAAILAVPALRRRFFLGALGAGGFAGLIDIGSGASFLSDVIFAIVFMAFIAIGLAWLVLERFAVYFEEESPLHQRATHAGRRTTEYSRRLWEQAQRNAGPARDRLNATAQRTSEAAKRALASARERFPRGKKHEE